MKKCFSLRGRAASRCFSLRGLAASKGRWLALGLGAIVCAQTNDAEAAGLFVAERGARPLARAGAFVAGADDLGAIAYNPAGIFDAGSSFLIDGAYVDFQAHYTRQALVTQVDPNTGAPVATYVQTFEQTTGSTPFLPIPTIAGSFRPHPQWTVALGAFAPYAAQLDYPLAMENGQPGPQRYSAVSLKGSVLAVVGAWAAFAPNKHLRFGAGLGLLVGTFNSLLTFSACIPDRFLCAQEDSSWDVLTELKAAPIVAPYASAGMIWQPIPMVRVGLSGQLPTWIQSGGTLRTRLPAAPLFERASQQGDGVEVKFWVPPIIRLGVELRPLPALRLELAGKYEAWSMHDKIEVDPQGISLQDVALLPFNYLVPTVVQERRFQDSLAIAFGAEYLAQASKRVKVIPRGGISYESSAVPNAYMSALTPDADKVTTALGLGVQIDGARFDLTYARVWNFDTTVDPATGQQYPARAVVSNPPQNPMAVNGGIYSSDVNVVALGFSYSIAPPAKPYVLEHEEVKPPPPPPPPPKRERPKRKVDDDD